MGCFLKIHPEDKAIGEQELPYDGSGLNLRSQITRAGFLQFLFPK